MAQFSRYNGVINNAYLYSTVGNQFASYTVSASVVTADATGNKWLNRGVLMAKITVGAEANKVGPYDANAWDGRQTSTNIVGYNDTFCQLRRATLDVDKDVGVLYRGTVTAAQVIVYSSGTPTQGDPGATIQGYCRTASMHILHK